MAFNILAAYEYRRVLTTIFAHFQRDKHEPEVVN